MNNDLMLEATWNELKNTLERWCVMVDKLNSATQCGEVSETEFNATRRKINGLSAMLHELTKKNETKHEVKPHE